MNAGADVFEGFSVGFSASATMGVGTGVGSEAAINHYNMALAASRGAEELISFGHNLKVKRAGYVRLDWGNSSEDRALLNRLVADLSLRKDSLEVQRRALGYRAEF